jgi:hypothetical protein
VPPLPLPLAGRWTLLLQYALPREGLQRHGLPDGQNRCCHQHHGLDHSLDHSHNHDQCSDFLLQLMWLMLCPWPSLGPPLLRLLLALLHLLLVLVAPLH